MPLASSSPRRSVYPIGDGYHLKNSVLSLDVSSEADLSFVSSALMPMPEVRRIIATEETVALFAALHRKKINALVCQYQRPFSVGNLTLELLPAGTVLGGASLFIQTAKHSVLYAPHLQMETTGGELMLLRKADVLVIGLHHGDFSLPKRDKELQRLAKSIAASNKQLYVYCEAVDTAQEICVLAARLGCSVAMHASISAISKVYKPHRVADYRIYRRSRNYDVVILPYSHIKYRHRHVGMSFYVHDTSPAPLHPIKATEEFTISRFSPGARLQEVVRKVNPSEIYTVGDYAQTHCDKLHNKQNKKAMPVFAGHQPTLF